jgi:hypothetical protein
LLGIKKQVEVLNSSAASWGVGNQLGYIRKFGTFESDAVMKANWYSRFATTSKQQRRGGKSPADAESQTVIGNSRSVSKIRYAPIVKCFCIEFSCGGSAGVGIKTVYGKYAAI